MLDNMMCININKLHVCVDKLLCVEVDANSGYLRLSVSASLCPSFPLHLLSALIAQIINFFSLCDFIVSDAVGHGSD